MRVPTCRRREKERRKEKRAKTREELTRPLNGFDDASITHIDSRPLCGTLRLPSSRFHRLSRASRCKAPEVPKS